MTMSFGVAEFPMYASLDALVAAADAALYQAKRSGKNQVATAAVHAQSASGAGRGRGRDRLARLRRTAARPRRGLRFGASGAPLASVSVSVPFTSAQWISARESTVSFATRDWRLARTAQVRPATVIDEEETALTVPRASLRCFTGAVARHLPGPARPRRRRPTRRACRP